MRPSCALVIFITLFVAIAYSENNATLADTRIFSGDGKCNTNSDCPPSTCCSVWSYCGSTALHCNATNQPPSPSLNHNATENNATLAETRIRSQDGNCNSTSDCPPNNCCSIWSWCGSTPLHCTATNTPPSPSLIQNATENNATLAETNIRPREGNCNKTSDCPPNNCCSIWSWCGSTPLHCTATNPPPSPSLIHNARKTKKTTDANGPTIIPVPQIQMQTTKIKTTEARTTLFQRTTRTPNQTPTTRANDIQTQTASPVTTSPLITVARTTKVRNTTPPTSAPATANPNNNPIPNTLRISVPVVSAEPTAAPSSNNVPTTEPPTQTPVENRFITLQPVRP